MKKPIRVLQVIGSMNCGGAENMIMNLYRSIDREKIQFDFLVHTEQDCFFDKEIQKLGGRIYRVPQFKLINIIQYKKALNAFFKEHSSYAAVHGHVGGPACIYLATAKKYDIFAIAHSHSANSKKISFKNIMYWLLALITRRIADFFIGCSYKAGLVRFGKKLINSEKFLILPNAIKTEDFVHDENIRKQVRSDLGLTDEFVVGHVGRFTYAKNHEYLLKVFAEVLKLKKNTILLLLGDGELKTEIEKKIAELGLTENVILMGVRKDVNRFLQAMDCFVFPSHFEGLPVTAVEAQASGIPCFISDNVTDEVCITDLVQKLPIDIPASTWAEKILEVACNAERRDMSKEIASAGYDIATTVEWLTDFYIRNNRI